MPFRSGFCLMAVSILACASVGLLRGHGNDLYLPAEPFFEAVATVVERDVADLLGETRAGTLAGNELRLPHVRERAELLVVVHAGVQRHDRDAGLVRLLDRLPQDVGVGDGDGEAVGLEATAASMSWLILTMWKVSGGL